MITREDVVRMAGEKPDFILVDLPAPFGDKTGVLRLSEAQCEQITGEASRARSRFAAMACCDENGKRIFTDDDAEMLATTPGWFDALDAIWKAGAKFNNLLVESNSDGDSGKN